MTTITQDAMARSYPNLSDPKIAVRPGDNWLLVGRKGSGKTTAGKELVQRLARLWPTSRIYVLDIKLRDFNTWPNRIQTDELPPFPGRNQRIQVWQPTILIPEVVEEWLFRIRKDPPAILQVDELLALCYGKRDTSDEFTRITKLGRALPVGTISHTQDLVDIPRGVLSQPDHILRFRLKHPYETRLSSTLMSGNTDILQSKGALQPPDKYGFYYSYAEYDGNPLYYSSIHQFLGNERGKH